jgi:serine/threonine-protein kinase
VPKAGTQIDRDQAIVFVVSSGKPTIDVPSIAPSTPFDQANKALTAAKFKVSRVDEFDDTVPSGDVISVDPSDSATYGSTLTVTVSKGPEFVTIPDFPPLAPLSEVQPALENLHLNVDVQKAFGGVEGRVIKIDPGSGTQVHPGETVTVTIV